MERILKTFCILMVVFFVAVTLGSFADRGVYAGGGVNYKVTVRNPTESKCKVRLYVSKFILTPWGSGLTAIGAGQSHTFETGAICPAGIVGSYWDADSSAWRKMQDTSCLGHAVNYEGFSACCWGPINFRVCRKKGAEYSDIRDNDYGFCKE